MDNSNKGLSIVAGVASLVGAAALLALLLNPLEGYYFWIACGAGAIGALLGFVARRSGANTWNSLGLWLGLLDVVACVALAAWLTPVSVTTTEVTEVTEEAPAE